MEALQQILPVILELPDLVKWPGLILAGLLALRATFKLLSLRLIGAATNYVYAFIIILIMYHWGHDIHAFLLDYLKQHSDTQSN